MIYIWFPFYDLKSFLERYRAYYIWEARYLYRRFLGRKKVTQTENIYQPPFLGCKKVFVPAVIPPPLLCAHEADFHRQTSVRTTLHTKNNTWFIPLPLQFKIPRPERIGTK